MSKRIWSFSRNAQENATVYAGFIGIDFATERKQYMLNAPLADARNGQRAA
jgi:hypothetical protein